MYQYYYLLITWPIVTPTNRYDHQYIPNFVVVPVVVLVVDVIKLDLDVLVDAMEALLVMVGLVVVAEVEVGVFSGEICISFEHLYSSS